MRIAVIGNGVIGLTTAIELIIEGRDVVIYTKDPDHKSSEDTVSIVACALWQHYKLFTNLDEFGVEKFDLVKKVTLRSLNEFFNIINTDGPEKSGVYVKMKWQVSMGALVYKAKQLGCLTEYKYRNLLSTMSRYGYRKSEPYSDFVKSEKPTLLNQILEYFKDTMGYTLKEISDLSGFSVNELITLYGLDNTSQLELLQPHD